MNANARIDFGTRAICKRCEAELYVVSSDIELDPMRRTDKRKPAYNVTFVIEPCQRCLAIFKKLKEANITINLENCNGRSSKNR